MAPFQAREIGRSELSPPTNLEAIHWFFREGKWRYLSALQKQQIIGFMKEARLIVQDFPSDQDEVVEVKLVVGKAQGSFPSSVVEQVKLISSWISRLV